jgi:NAD dependent epimerase/dehydratase family enzyme
LGGRLGGGRQWFSWVALEDAVAVILRAITTDMTGVYNVTAPGPVTNRELTNALARVLRRPALFAVPAFALRGMLGGAADELLLASQRVMPRRLADAGFAFRYPEISGALNAALKGS